MTREGPGGWRWVGQGMRCDAGRLSSELSCHAILEADASPSAAGTWEKNGIKMCYKNARNR